MSDIAASFEARQLGTSAEPGPGIYALRCLATGAVYIGRADCVQARRRSHATTLRGGRGSARLQDAWDASDDWAFDVLERYPGCWVDVLERAGLPLSAADHAERDSLRNRMAARPRGVLVPRARRDAQRAGSQWFIAAMQ